MTSRQKQALATKNKIFEVTMRLGMTSGFENLTISDICREASISVGSFYHYFRSIDAVIQEQYSAYDQYIIDMLEVSPLHGSATDRIWQLFSLKYNYVAIRGPQFIVRQYRGQFTQLDSSNSVFFNENRVMHKTLTDILAAGAEQGEFSLDVTPAYLANVLLVFSRGITLDWALRNGGYDLQVVALDYLNIVLKQYITHTETAFNGTHQAETHARPVSALPEASTSA